MAASLEHILSQIQRWTSPGLREESDALLLERFIQRGEEAAFAVLVSRHGGMVLRSCRRVLGDVHEAEDAFQATFLILARKAKTLRRPAELPGWLHGVAHRIALKARTKNAVRVVRAPLPEELADERSDPLARLSARELLTVLNEEVARLPRGQRSAVVVCCLEGRTQEEAARLLGWTAGSLKGHLERGRRRLQARLLRRGIALSAALAVVDVARGEAAPALLLRSTIATALHGGAGPAAALAHSVLKTIFLSKLAGAIALTLVLALATSTAVVLVQRGSTLEIPEDETPIGAAPLAKASESKPRTRADALGDPLPDGAIARLGSQRLRHSEEIARITFAPDGKRLISQGLDGVRFWDAATGKQLHHIAPKAGQMWIGGDLSPDGKWLVGTTINPGPLLTGPLELWDAENGKKIADVGEGYCTAVRCSPDGKRLAYYSGIRREVIIYDLENRRELQSCQTPPQRFGVSTCAFSINSLQLLTSDRTGLSRLWDVATGRQLQEFKPVDTGPAAIGRSYAEPVLSPDGKLLALIEQNERQSPAPGKIEWKARISVRDTATGKQVRLLTCAVKEFVPGFAFPFMSLLFRRDSKRLLTSGPDEFLREWDATTGQELRRIALPHGFPFSLHALSRDEKQLAAVMLEGRAIQLIDLVNGKVREEPAGHPARVDLALLVPDGRTAITGNGPFSFLIWDVAKGTVRRRFDNPDLPIFGLRLAADGRSLFSSSIDNNIRVWDLETGKQRRVVKVSPGFVAEDDGFVVSRDGKIVALVDRQLAARSIRVLDGETGKERQRFRAPDSIYGLSLSADGRSLVGWSLERKVHVWDLAAGVKRHEYALPPDPPGRQTHYRVAVSPDDRLFAACTQQVWMSKDAKADHWLIVKDLATGLDVQRIRNPPSDYGVLTFSPDGRTLVYSGTFDATIRFLEVASGRERHRLAGLQGRATALCFSASGDRLISGSSDTTALIWDLSLPRPARAANAEELQQCWDDLAGTDAARAYDALRKLAASPSSAVPFMGKHLRPAVALDEKHVVLRIADLDSNEFAPRDKAMMELKKLKELPLPIFRTALQGKPSLELRRRLEELIQHAESAWWDDSGERLRSLRAIEALELAGTREARELLQMLAAGAEGARLTAEAKAALERLGRRR